ncbi:MAG: sulfite exporter TauE/SafE family protein [Candidatus Sungbacteria bacterium]|uniref:Probable membrane transporter protein n=1 Tax=Candidatus Sungiibacteriota bacterium TaxID=2750080 RepID=A0A932YZC1_9BACT|nr:sulfite exporter TauE/SafE family protein [Candidatus Sungbacteria bacterium]
MTDILLLSLLTLIASIIGTVTGFGISTTMVQVLAFWLPLPLALLVAGIVHAANDVWKMLLFRSGLRWRLALLFGVPGIAAAWAGASLVFSVDPEPLKAALGIMIAAYAIFLLIKPAFKIKPTPTAAVVGGAFSAFIIALLGVGGPIRSAVLAAFNLPAAAYIATIGMASLFVDVTRIGVYLASGTALTGNLLYGMPIFIAATFAGAAIAKRIVGRIPQRSFRSVVAVFLIAIGIGLWLN